MESLKTKVKGLVKILWSSDQHTVHPNTPTRHIISNLRDFYFTSHNLAEIDLCVFGGDFFDHLVDASDKDMRIAEYFIKEFLERCRKHNVIVRVLEGTSSHDREQPEIFVVQSPDGLDLKWVKDLSIEYFPTLGFNALYVPDNMGTKTTDEIWELTEQLLAREGLMKVDFCFFHGAFRYQLPAHLNAKAHDENKWSSIVDQIVLAGHVHIPSEYLNIRVSGSFDRISHGEEHPKGGYYVEYDISEKQTKAKFWENKKALPYVTIKLTPEDTASEIIEKVVKVIERNQYPLGSHIRLKNGSGLTTASVLAQFKEDYPNYNFKLDNVKNEDKLVGEDLYTDRKYDGINLNADNITETLLDDVFKMRDDLDESKRDELRELMKEFL